MHPARLLPTALLTLSIGCVPVLESPDGGVVSDWEAPDNAWPLQEPPADLGDQGFFEGQVIPDFRLRDQHGDEVSLWQFYGHIVVVDISTMWCRPCQVLAEGAEATYQDFADDGVLYLTVLPENVHGEPPSTDDLGIWADTFGLTSPVVSDPGKQWAGPAVPGNQYPFVAVVGRDLVVEQVLTSPVTDERVRIEVEGLLHLDAME